jgi:hypothetical protein
MAYIPKKIIRLQFSPFSAMLLSSKQQGRTGYMPQESTEQSREQNTFQGKSHSLSWWSWRPGIQPHNALLIGGMVAFIAVLLISIGLVTLVLGIRDSVSQPVRIPGVVVSHNSTIMGQQQLTIRELVGTIRAANLAKEASNLPGEVSPVVTSRTFQAIRNGDSVMLDYSPHLYTLYALEYGGQRYTLPDANLTSDIFGAIVLLCFGLMLFPYPALLAHWGWRDMYSWHSRQDEICKMRASVVNLRETGRRGLRSARAGLTPHSTRAWYGVALSPIDSGEDAAVEKQVLTFSISFETYSRLRVGEVVEITYSPRVHYVYALERAE